MAIAVKIFPALFAVSIWGAPTLAAADGAKLIRYGEHLSQECTTCHRRDGVDNGIPSILGMRVEEFVETLKHYQSGARDNAAMVSVAQSLDEDQMKALAAYFATLTPAGAAATASQRK